MLLKATTNFFDGKQLFGFGEIVDSSKVDTKYLKNGFLVPLSPKDQEQVIVPPNPDDIDPPVDEPEPPEAPVGGDKDEAPGHSCEDCLPLPPLSQLMDDRSIPILAERGITNTAEFREAIREASDKLQGVQYLTPARLQNAAKTLGL